MTRLALASLITGMLLGATASTITIGPYAWYVSRAAGLLAFMALSLSVVLGLLISSRRGPAFLPKVAMFELHQFLAVLGLGLVGLHSAALMFDATVPFTVVELLVPFAAPYQPVWVGLGVGAAWLSAAVAASFWFKKRIGQKAWRKLHFASFAVYIIALGHGLFAGTDSQAAPVYWGYVISLAAVTSLTLYRVLATRKARSRSGAKSERGQPRPAIAARRPAKAAR
jgi:predicted ferric reductase